MKPASRCGDQREVTPANRREIVEHMSASLDEVPIMNEISQIFIDRPSPLQGVLPQLHRLVRA